MNEPHLTAARGFTVADLAARYRVGEDKIRAWIRAGLLRAINTSSASCARPRFVILPEHLAAFEQARSACRPPKPPRRRKRTGQVDFYPD